LIPSRVVNALGVVMRTPDSAANVIRGGGRAVAGQVEALVVAGADEHGVAGDDRVGRFLHVCQDAVSVPVFASSRGAETE
jgi:hypothetical protein